MTVKVLGIWTIRTGRAFPPDKELRSALVTSVYWIRQPCQHGTVICDLIQQITLYRVDKMI